MLSRELSEKAPKWKTKVAALIALGTLSVAGCGENANATGPTSTEASTASQAPINYSTSELPASTSGTVSTAELSSSPAAVGGESTTPETSTESSSTSPETSDESYDPSTLNKLQYKIDPSDQVAVNAFADEIIKRNVAQSLYCPSTDNPKEYVEGFMVDSINNPAKAKDLTTFCQWLKDRIGDPFDAKYIATLKRTGNATIKVDGNGLPIDIVAPTLSETELTYNGLTGSVITEKRDVESNNGTISMHIAATKNPSTGNPDTAWLSYVQN